MKKLTLFFVFLILIVALTLSASACSPTEHELSIDYSLSEGEIMHGATGWLYGIAEPDVPDSDLLQALSPAIAAVKAPDGTQHPIGDVMNVADTFLSGGGQYLFVYMQDIYPEWYYVYRGIDDYRDKVITMTQKLAKTDYVDKLIFCPFNETDNGEWYGNFKKSSSREKFYSDWIDIYSTIRTILPEAKIAGPGFMRYDSDYIEEFFDFCKNNDCLPDMTVWHELSDKSYYKFEENYDDYREIEKKLGMAKLPICISEYGEMSDNGIPGTMLQYISMYESKKVYACIAYWRLADNLSELAADATTPTAAWWMYYWYGNMSGNTYSVVNSNEKRSHLRAVTSFDEDNKEITILTSGGNGTSTINLNSLSSLPGMSGVDKLYASVESVDFNGLGAECISPVNLDSFSLNVTNGKAQITLNGMREDRCYRIVLSANENKNFVTDETATRYEAEDATLNGFSLLEKWKAKDDSSAYAVSGKLIKNVKGKDKSIDFSVNVPNDGFYDVSVCYASGYSSDGSLENRTYSYGNLSVDGSEVMSLSYPNTLSNTTTAAITAEKVYLKKGTRLLSLNCTQGEIYFDFIDVIPSSDDNTLHSYPASDGLLFIVTPAEGYYTIGNTQNNSVYFNNTLISDGDILFLKKGINIFESSSQTELSAEPYDCAPLDTVVSLRGDFSDIKHVSGEDNAVLINVFAPVGGLYALNLYYSNNAQSGEHSYNVELVERYARVVVNSKDYGTVFFRNTYSWDTYASKLIYVYLESGDNIISLFNDKSYSPDGEASYLPLINTDRIAIYKMIV